MAGYVHHCFTNEERYALPFSGIMTASGPDRLPATWHVQLGSGQRIWPEPEGLIARRMCHPDVKHPPALDLLSVESKPVVSEVFRQIVLELEPDTHQFLPIALFDEERQPLPGRYWLM